MRGGDTDGSCLCLTHSPGFSVASLRTWCLFAVAAISVFILVWMVIEQDKVRTCTSYKDGLTLQKSNFGVKQDKAEVIFNALARIVAPTPPSSTNHSSRKDEDTWNYNWDKKQWQNKKDANNAKTRTILLIRHGKYDFQTGSLTEMGRQQANLTGLRLKELNMNFKVIIHSPLLRAVQTAQLIHSHLQHLPLREDDYLKEGGPKPPHPTVTYWGLPERDYFVDGPRLEAAFRKYFFRADLQQQEQTFEILVGHGNIFRFFALRALQFPSDAWMRVFIAHASITLLHINPDGTVTMSKFGDSGHLPPDLVTY